MEMEFKRKSRKHRVAYLNSVRNLYGSYDGNQCKDFSGFSKNVVQIDLLNKNKTKKINNTPTELQDQIKLCSWLRKAGIRFYAIPNGGFRNMSEAVKLKASGISPGIPDICIPIPIEPYHGLYIELKRISGGRVSKEQQDWIDFLSNKGYYAIVAKGFEEAKSEVEYYFSLHPKQLA